MNRVIIVGRLTKDPEIRVTEAQKTIGRFTVAVNRNKNEADYINCVAFDRRAELLEKYFHKGDRIGVFGSIKTGSYEKEGRRISTFDIVVDEIEFLQDRKQPGVDNNPFLDLPEA